MEAPATSIQVAQILGITTSAFLGGELPSLVVYTCTLTKNASLMLGAMWHISWMTVPTWLLAPTPLLVRQWRLAFERGKRTAPPMSLVPAASFFYLAYKLHNTPLSVNHPRGELFAIAAALSISIAPFTLVFMAATNNKLMARAKEMEGVSVTDEEAEKRLPAGESAKELVDWWGVLNLIRGTLPVLASGVGAWASLG